LVACARRQQRRLFGGQVILAGIGLEVFQLKLKLVEKPTAALGASAILLAAQPGDLQLEVGDHRFGRALANHGIGEARLGLVGAFERGGQQRLERFDVVREGRCARVHDGHGTRSERR
jgi:hypothetical protein